MTLACVLSHGNAPVRWVKDGVTIEANSGLVLEEEGPQRCLVIPAAGPEHSGRYICHTVDDTMTFTIQVSGECSAQRPATSGKKAESRMLVGGSFGKGGSQAAMLW